MLKRNLLMMITSCVISCALVASEGDEKASHNKTVLLYDASKNKSIHRILPQDQEFLQKLLYCYSSLSGAPKIGKCILSDYQPFHARPSKIILMIDPRILSGTPIKIFDINNPLRKSLTHCPSQIVTPWKPTTQVDRMKTLEKEALKGKAHKLKDDLARLRNGELLTQRDCPSTGWSHSTPHLSILSLALMFQAE